MKSILPIPPALQAVWTSVYAATVQGVHASNVNDDPLHSGEPASMAESAAWEAVRRANGGEMPEEPRKTDDKTWKRSAMREALLWFADEGHYVGLPRHQTGVEKAREALGIPCRHEDDSLMPLTEALTHGAAIGANVEEPTNEDMAEVLAPIVAAAHSGNAWASWPEQDRPYKIARFELLLQNDKVSADLLERQLVDAALASWKAARAWGRK